MELLHRFQGTLNAGFQGNLAYRVQLPSHCSALYISLAYDKEYGSDKRSNVEELRKICEAYQGRPVSLAELKQAMGMMKTEIQLALMIGGEFVGNVHMPGTKKEMYVSKDEASRGCLPRDDFSGGAQIIINVFQVLEDQTSYCLEIKGELQGAGTRKGELQGVGTKKGELQGAGTKKGELQGVGTKKGGVTACGNELSYTTIVWNQMGA